MFLWNIVGRQICFVWGQLHVCGLKTTEVTFCSLALSNYFCLNLIKQTWYRYFYIMNQSPWISFEILEIYNFVKQPPVSMKIFLCDTGRKVHKQGPFLKTHHAQSSSPTPFLTLCCIIWCFKFQWLTTKWKAPLPQIKLQIPLSLNI